MEHTELEKVLAALKRVRPQPAVEENALHELIAKALDDTGIGYIHEAPFECGRLDFLVGDIAIEVKRSRPNKKTVLEQVRRYMSSPYVKVLILASPYSIDLPKFVNRKRLIMFSLSKNNGLAF